MAHGICSNFSTIPRDAVLAATHQSLPFSLLVRHKQHIPQLLQLGMVPLVNSTAQLLTPYSAVFDGPYHLHFNSH